MNEEEINNIEKKIGRRLSLKEVGEIGIFNEMIKEDRFKPFVKFKPKISEEKQNE